MLLMTEKYSHMPYKLNLIKTTCKSSIDISCTTLYLKYYFHNYSCIFYLKVAE